VFALDLVGNFGTVLTQLYRNSDTAAAPVLAQLYAHAPAGSTVTLGSHAYYEEFLVLLLTRGLPLHRQLWLLGPILMSLAGLCLLASCVRRLYGWWVAAIVISVLICLGDLGMVSAFSWDARGNAVVHTVVLLAALVLGGRRISSLSPGGLTVAAIALGLFSALPASGDVLFIVWGLMPFTFAALAGAYRSRDRASRRLAGFAVGTTVVALIGGALLAAVLRGDGIEASAAQASYLVFATPAQLAKNLGSFLEGFTSLAGGDFFGQGIRSRLGAVTFLTGSLVLVALGAQLLAIKRRVLLVAGARMSQAGAAGEPAHARFLYFAFWSATLILGLGAYLLASPLETPASGRYLFGPYVALGALLPLLLTGSRSRALVTVAASLFAICASYRLHLELLPSRAPGPATAQAVERYVLSLGATKGYSEYWVSTALTWEMNFHAEVVPVWPCPAATSNALCSLKEVDISSWYRPRPHVRSFLIIDPNYPDVAGPSAGFGKPIASKSIDNLHVYVYPYDIAARLVQRYF